MNLPAHLFRLQSTPTEPNRPAIHASAASEATPARPLFRAPALPTPQQLHNELPFFVTSRPRLRERL